jgi:calcium-dependent protein kinase
MDHPHVARLVDVYEEKDRITLVMECMQGGELFDRVIAKKRFDEKDAAVAAYQMLLAINYLHSHGIVHRDIKLENWLYESNESDHLKLIDFGFSKVWGEDPKVRMHMSCGTLSYVSPEVLNKSYTSQCDLWSLGVVIFILLAGYMPFAGPDEKQIKNIKDGRFTFKPEKWNTVSESATDFVKKLMVVDPKARLDAPKALEHPWIVNRHEVMQDDGPDMCALESLVNFSKESKFRRQCMLAMAWSLSNEERAKLRSSFMNMDKNKCGTITLGEFKKCVEENMDIGDTDVNQIFAAIDSANNGEIQYSEFLAAIVSSRIHLYDDYLQTAFRRFDTDASGFITFDNLKEVLSDLSDAEIKEIMDEVNSSHDGKITQQEFVDFIHKKEQEEREAEVSMPQGKRQRHTLFDGIVNKELEKDFGESDSTKDASPLARHSRVVTKEKANVLKTKSKPEQ